MKQGFFEIVSNDLLAPSVYRMVLKGDTSAITAPGQFVNIKLEGLYLRRPISVCDVNGDLLTIIYKVVGKGTEAMSQMQSGKLDLLTGLGNGYDLTVSGHKPVLLGGGVGVPPMYLLCKRLLAQGKQVTVLLGFNTKTEIFYEEEFSKLGADVIVTTVDGTYGVKVGQYVETADGIGYETLAEAVAANTDYTIPCKYKVGTNVLEIY